MQLIKREGYNKIYETDSFDRDYRKLFKREGDYGFYEKKFHHRLKILDNTPTINHALLDKNIEVIDRDLHLYSIRHVSKLNPRVLFFHEAEDGNYVLLCSFFERNKSDYDLGKNRAKAILKELEL